VDIFRVGHGEFVIVTLLMAVAALSALACRLSVPYPVAFVVGGALFGFVPALPPSTSTLRSRWSFPCRCLSTASVFAD
jgi:hypothetical protein